MDASSLLDGIRTVAAAFGLKIATLLLTPGEATSLPSLLAALGIAAAYLAVRRRRRGRPARLRLLARALFRTFRLRPTQRADVFYFLFNTFVCGAIIGGALLSFAAISDGTGAVLARLLGPARPSPLSDVAARAAITLALFLAYELGYWVDHWLSHRIPFLWDFHRVHHSAEELTPLTVFRVHPMESLKFANILSVFTGVANGVAQYGLGGGVESYAVSGTNVILVGFVYAYLHLQHTHLWIAFRGPAGRLLQSPAHHQIHHSSHPSHHNKNFGGCLAVWDWLFGTLHIPNRAPEKLHFGVKPGHGHDHSLTEILVRPFIRAGRRLPRFVRGRMSARSGRAPARSVSVPLPLLPAEAGTQPRPGPRLSPG